MSSLQWVQTVLSLLLQSTLVIVVTWFLERHFRCSGTRVRIWTNLYLSIIGLITAGLLLPRLQLINPWVRMEPIVLVDIARAQHTIGVSMIAIWAIGTLAILLQWFVHHLSFRRLIRRCCPIPVEQHLRLSRLVDPSLMHVSGKDVVVYGGPEELGPFCYQLHHPIIVLPVSLLNGHVEDLRNVLVHELTHLKSRHAMQLFLEKVVQSILWFQPLVWFSSRRASLVREFECDDAGSGGRHATIGYLKTLITIVEGNRPVHRVGLQISETMSQLTIRAKRLAENQVLVHDSRRIRAFTVVPFAVAILASQLWLPTNPLAVANSRWSPWPTWSAAVLHELDIAACDFDKFDSRREFYELMLHDKMQ